MDRPLLLGSLACAAGLAGYFGGLRTRPPAETPRPPADAAKPWSNSGAESAPSDSMIDVPATEARLLGDLRHGTVEELTRSLDSVLADRRLPATIAQIYRDALVSRLVDLGAADALFTSDGFSATEAELVTGAAMRALVRKDADVAEVALDRLPPGEKRKRALGELLREFARTNPERGLALVEKDPDGKDRAPLFFSAWARTDPVAAFAAANERSEALTSALPAVISAWAPIDPDAAWQAIQGVSPNRYRLQEVLVSSLVHHDARLALDVIARTPPLADSFMLQGVGTRIANNFDEADAAVETLPPGAGRSALIQGIARAHANDPEGVLAWAETLLPGERTAAINDLFDALGQSDPGKAIDLASSALDGQARQKAVAAIVNGWARDDFEAAFASVTTTMDADTMREALPYLFMYHAFPDADAVRSQAERVRKLPADRRGDVLRAWGMGSGWRLRADTLVEIEQLDASDRAAFAEGVMERLIEVSPDAASRLIAMLPPEVQTKHAWPIAHAMSRLPARETAEFLGRLPETSFADAKRGALNRVVRDWAYTGPDAATAFVASLPTGTTKDRATAELARQFRKFDLDRASASAATVTDAELRAELLVDLSGDWARVDPARGRAILQPLLKSDADRRSVESLFSAK